MLALSLRISPSPRVTRFAGCQRAEEEEEEEEEEKEEESLVEEEDEEEERRRKNFYSKLTQ